MQSNEEEAAMAAQAAAEEAAAAAAEADRQAYEESRLRELAKQGEYLGDGVYATFDGYQVWLKAKRDGMEHSIALEADVMRKAVRYARNFYTRLCS